MKNADQPINPAVAETRNGTPFFEYNLPHSQKQYAGLTKREYFAGLALQGMLSNPYFPTVASIDEFPRKAVSLADELLKELETTQAD